MHPHSSTLVATHTGMLSMQGANLGIRRTDMVMPEISPDVMIVETSQHHELLPLTAPLHELMSL
jgi:hypothetical protein